MALGTRRTGADWLPLGLVGPGRARDLRSRLADLRRALGRLRGSLALLGAAGGRRVLLGMQDDGWGGRRTTAGRRGGRRASGPGGSFASRCLETGLELGRRLLKCGIMEAL